MAAEKEETITMLQGKLCKRKKMAIRFMEQRVMSRLSDYFSCWKLHMLLQSGQTLGQISQSQILDPSECSLDYSVWRNYLEKESSKKGGE